MSNQATRIKPGTIYRAINPSSPDTESALVLITRVDLEGQRIQASLLSPESQLCTSIDLLLTVEEGGFPYPFIVHGDILGYLHFEQLACYLGEVPPEVLIALAALRNDDPVERHPAGPPLTQRTDPRWPHKLAELRRLQRLNIHPHT